MNTSEQFERHFSPQKFKGSEQRKEKAHEKRENRPIHSYLWWSAYFTRAGYTVRASRFKAHDAVARRR